MKAHDGQCRMGTRLAAVLLFGVAVSVLFASVSPRPAFAQQDGDNSVPPGVSALGRIEPKNGVLRISASSVPEAMSGAVLVKLEVDIGDNVEQGQLLAVTDSAGVLASKLSEAEKLLILTRQQAAASRSSADATCVRAGVFSREADRLASLLDQSLASEEQADRASGDAQASTADCAAARIAADVAEADVSVAEARVDRQRMELERAFVYAPFDGRVLAINAREGERISEAGVLELGRVDQMYAIAEVYETDVSRLAVGQRASIESDALPAPITGRVERIRPLVRKQDQIGTDPAARKDGRIVEVEVLLDNATDVSSFTNLQVDVHFKP